MSAAWWLLFLEGKGNITPFIVGFHNLSEDVSCEWVYETLFVHRNVHGCRDRCEYTIRMWFQASCWVDGGAFYQSRYRRNKKNLKTINDYITLTFFKILWYDIKLWVGWCSNILSLSFSHSKLWSTEWSFENIIIFIHVYALKCMSVTITKVVKVHVTLQSTINGKFALAMALDRACSSFSGSCFTKCWCINEMRMIELSWWGLTYSNSPFIIVRRVMFTSSSVS